MIKFLFVLCCCCVVFCKGDYLPCLHELTKSQGTIKTPNYPNAYPRSFSCVWTITVTVGNYIELLFKDFDVEAYDDCKTDVLEIKDGGTANAPLIGILLNTTQFLRTKGGQYCNSRRPPRVITSTNNQIRLWFLSDSTIQLRGFKLHYRTLFDEECGGKINAVHGEISSPRFPLHYPRDRRCEWKIKVPKGKFVALRFLFFEIETACPSGLKCRCLDSVSIKDGHSNNAKLLGTYCFGAPMPLVTSGNELSIIFNSDLYGRLQGFKAIFTQSSTNRCGGDYFISNGTITSPQFAPAAKYTYPTYSDCTWTITAQKHQFISLHFLFMDVTKSINGGCQNDYIEVRDGPTKDSLLLGYFCNAYKPEVLISHGSTLYIHFHSGNGKGGKGFEINFKTHRKSCDTALGMEDKRILKYSLTASSTFKIAHEPHELSADYGRLNGPYAWCSQEQKSNYIVEYFQIHFPDFMKVTKIATQGYTMVGNLYYVTKYKLKYQVGKRLVHYVSLVDSYKGRPYTLFNGNRFYNVSKVNTLSPSVVLKVLRIDPLDYQSGRRRHICLRVEIFGCKLETGAGRIKLLLTQKASIHYSTYKTLSKTWIIAPESKQTNSVYLFEVTKLQADCATSKLLLSNDGTSFSSNSTFCGSNKGEVMVFRMSQQIWVNFEINKTPMKFQEVQFDYHLQDLGGGRVIDSQHGVIHGFHKALMQLNRTSVWLFILPKGSQINLEFQRVQLISKVNGPFLLVKNGLKESSHVVRKLSGVQKPSAFVYSHHTLRIEYHPGAYKKLLGYRHDGFTLKYSTWKNLVRNQKRTH